MPSKYQIEQLRAKARAAGKIPASDKKKAVYKSPTTDRQKGQAEIDRYKMIHYGKKSSSTQPSASGGSKAVRKVTSPDSGDTDLVKRLRKKPFKYLKTK